MSPSHPATPDAPAFDMTITVGENTAREMGLTRRDVDEWAAYSHGQAIASIDKGYFVDEIVPMELAQPDGSIRIFDTDEHPRRGTTVETLAGLPVLHPEIPGFTVTAGNSAGLNDAAAAVVLTSGDYAAAHGLAPLARIRSWSRRRDRAGAHRHRSDPGNPEGTRPRRPRPSATSTSSRSTRRSARCRSRPSASSASPQEILNVNGSGCSLGHPIAATGARMVVTMLDELRRRGGGLGVVSMCAGGGMGAAMVLEVPAP